GLFSPEHPLLRRTSQRLGSPARFAPQGNRVVRRHSAIRIAVVGALLALAPAVLAQARPSWLRDAPDFINHSVFGVQAWQWTGLAVIASFAFLVSLVGRFVVILVLRARERFIRGSMSSAVRRLIRRAAAV